MTVSCDDDRMTGPCQNLTEGGAHAGLIIHDEYVLRAHPILS